MSNESGQPPSAFRYNCIGFCVESFLTTLDFAGVRATLVVNKEDGWAMKKTTQAAFLFYRTHGDDSLMRKTKEGRRVLAEYKWEYRGEALLRKAMKDAGRVAATTLDQILTDAIATQVLGDQP